MLQQKQKFYILFIVMQASLEFVLPTHLVKETLDTAKLNKIG